MNIITIQTGEFLVNTYVVHDKSSKECIIIDPGGSFLKIKGILAEYGLVPKAVFLTHGHFDHIGAVSSLKEEFDVKVYIHKSDADMLIDGKKNLSIFLYRKDIFCGEADYLLEDNEQIEICGLTIKTIHTPGHSPGGVTYLMDGAAFTGDTLFNMSIGRADFTGCDASKLNESLIRIKKEIPKDYKIFPGHGNESSFEYELENNPYLDL